MVGLGVPPTFVGRRSEMGVLADALEAAVSWRGSAVLLCGEPGIGKSRTVEELVAKAEYDRAEIVWGVCEEGGRAVSYWPWIQVLGSLVERRSTAALIDEMGAGSDDIAVVLPALFAKLPSVTAALTVEPLQARFRLFQSVSSFLRRAAASRPLVVVVEDLHWADASSALLFTAVAQEIRDAAILLVGTVRAPSMGDSTSLSDLVAGVARTPESHVLRLEGLNESDVIEFVRQRTAVTVPDAVAAELRVRTGGNPFFLNEVVKLVADDGSTSGSRLDVLEHGVPPSVRGPCGVGSPRCRRSCVRCWRSPR